MVPSEHHVGGRESVNQIVKFIGLNVEKFVWNKHAIVE